MEPHGPDGAAALPTSTATSWSADGWTVARLVVGLHRTNAYIVRHARRVLVVDPAGDADVLLAEIPAGSNVTLVATHTHWDHLGAAAAIHAATGAALVIHAADARLLSMAPRYARQVDRVELELPGEVRHWDEASPVVDALREHVTLLHVPGHTRGSVALRVGSFVFTGDTLLRERAGSAKPPFGNAAALTGSLRELRRWLRVDDRLLPGHGREWSGDAASRWLDAHLAQPAAASQSR